jgi:hypothetical protein
MERVLAEGVTHHLGYPLGVKPEGRKTSATAIASRWCSEHPCILIFPRKSVEGLFLYSGLWLWGDSKSSGDL